MNIAAIPTTFQGVRMRSRLEARWAAFFNGLGWLWDYEPCLALRGYIPDFIVRGALPDGEPLLIECKPFVVVDKSAIAHCTKIARSGWDGASLLVGAVLFPGEAHTLGLGRLYTPSERAWCDGQLIHDVNTWRVAPVCGKLAGRHYIEAIGHWNTAGNATQWKPPTVDTGNTNGKPRVGGA